MRWRTRSAAFGLLAWKAAAYRSTAIADVAAFEVAFSWASPYAVRRVSQAAEVVPVVWVASQAAIEVAPAEQPVSPQREVVAGSAEVQPAVEVPAAEVPPVAAQAVAAQAAEERAAEVESALAA